MPRENTVAMSQMSFLSFLAAAMRFWFAGDLNDLPEIETNRQLFALQVAVGMPAINGGTTFIFWLAFYVIALGQLKNSDRVNPGQKLGLVLYGQYVTWITLICLVYITQTSLRRVRQLNLIGDRIDARERAEIFARRQRNAENLARRRRDAEVGTSNPQPETEDSIPIYSGTAIDVESQGAPSRRLGYPYDEEEVAPSREEV